MRGAAARRPGCSISIPPVTSIRSTLPPINPSPAPGEVLAPSLLPLAGTFAEAKSRAIERFEAAYLEALLRRCRGNLSKASREADIARNYLRALLKKRGLYHAS